MDFDEFIKERTGCSSIVPGFAVWEVDNSDYLLNVDFPEMHIQLFIERGTMSVLIDNQKTFLLSNSIVDILHSRMFVTKASDDISAIFILTTETFVSNFINNKPPFSINYIMEMLEHPVLLLNQGQSATMKERLKLLLNLFGLRSHYHQYEMVKCALWMVYLEMSNIFMHQKEDENNSSETDSKRMLFMKFVKLIPLYIKNEHSIGFYASKLCVSCQYLERVVKMISGQTAYQWIQRTLIGEVNHELKESEKSIQQISNEYGFPDQATFAKYYKRNTTMTPVGFRNKNLK